MDWSPYKALCGISFTQSDFSETLDGGQAFRWRLLSADNSEYDGVFGKNHLRLKWDENKGLMFSHPKKTSENEALNAVRDYLDFDRDYTALRNELFSKKDSVMRLALKEYPHLRILRQDPAEALMCFICSSSKRIVQIKQCVELLAENLGDKIDDERRALPSFERIAEAPIELLRACKLGFRAEYLKKTAQKITQDKFSPASLREIPYAEAKNYLISLSGIGEKVADCILLFGAGRFEAFPVDTWIRKGMSSLYGTSEDAKLIREFAAKKFGANAGFAQQLIFASVRKGATIHLNTSDKKLNSKP